MRRGVGLLENRKHRGGLAYLPGTRDTLHKVPRLGQSMGQAGVDWSTVHRVSPPEKPFAHPFE